MLVLIGYVYSGILWIIGAKRIITEKDPKGILFQAIAHIIELAVIGLETGRKYGKSIPESVVLCMTFGFTWWLPLILKMKSETFTDADFVRTAEQEARFKH
ncbi:MAG: hypothetical protein GX241_01010 [Ruminococcaceae bacterium]|nr:hypothetical protein [Oscillospiraceae bacterium]